MIRPLRPYIHEAANTWQAIIVTLASYSTFRGWTTYEASPARQKEFDLIIQRGHRTRDTLIATGILNA